MTPIENYTISRLWNKNVSTIPAIDNKRLFEIWFEVYKERLTERVYRRSRLQTIASHTSSISRKYVKALVEQHQPIIKELVLTYLNERGKKIALEMMKVRKELAKEREQGKTRAYVKNLLYEKLAIPDGKGALELLTFSKRLTLRAAYAELQHLVRTIRKHDSYFDGAFDDQTPVHELLTKTEIETLAEMLDATESPAQIALALIHNRVNQFLARNKKKPITKRRLKNLLFSTPDVYRL